MEARNDRHGQEQPHIHEAQAHKQEDLYWLGYLIGPIHAEHALYKIYNNELMKTAQKSELGIPLKSQTADTVHATNKLSNLYNIRHLTMD